MNTFTAPPRPGAKFWDRIARRYAAKPVPDTAVYEEKLAIMRGLLRPTDKVFEFGCGTGSTAIALAPHAGQILATDLSGEMIAIAREKATAEGAGNVAFEVATLEDMAGREGQFDVVMGHSILHLVPDLEGAVAQAHALLKPGGLFISSTPCLGDWLRIFALIGPVGHWLGLLPDVRVFTRRRLDKVLEAAGFEIERAWQPSKRGGVFIVARRRA